MTCFSEMTYAIYCDGELPSDETRQVELHLAACSGCRQRVAALREENRALIYALQATEEAPARMSQTASLFSLGWKIAAVFLIATLPYLSINWITQQFVPETSWLNPMKPSVQFSLFTNLVFYLTNLGVSMISQIEKLANLPAFLLLAVFAVLVFTRLRIRLLRPGVGLLMLLVLVVPGFSLDMRTSKTVVTVGPTETLNESLIAAADSIEIEGNINGDLLAFGRRVEIRGRVTGDVIAFAQRIEISGEVGGNVFTCGRDVDFLGHVSHSVYACGQALLTSAHSQIDGDAIVAGDLTLEGAIKRSVLAAGNTADFRGSIGENLTFHGGQFTITPPAHIQGDVHASVIHMKSTTIDPGAFIGGKKEISVRQTTNPYLRPKFYFWKAIGLLGALLVGLILRLLVPQFLDHTTQGLRAWGRSLGLGFAILVGTPVAIIILGITLIGLPVALISLVFYIIGFYLAGIVCGLFVGRFVLRSSLTNVGGFLLALLVGCLILMVVYQIPYGIGAIVHLLVFCFGFGTICYQLYRAVRPQQA